MAATPPEEETPTAPVGDAAPAPPAPPEAEEEESLTPEQIVGTYKEMRGVVSQMADKIAELELQYNEHTLVINTMEPMAPERKAFHLINGVLVQLSVGEILPIVTSRKDGLKSALVQHHQALRQQEKKTSAWKTKYGIQTQQEREMMERAQAAQA